MKTLPHLPHYRLMHFCGKGAGGEVWTTCGPDGHLRAVKFFSGKTEFAAARRFMQFSGSHPALLKIFCCAADHCVMEAADNASGISGEYCPDTLEHRLRRHRFPEAEIMAVMGRIVSGTAELHRHGWAHRDLKPENILFVHGALKIADPGLLCPLDNPSSLAGTPEYRPPWKCTAGECDLYAIGKMLYRMFSGFPVEDYPHLPPDPMPVRELNRLALRCCGDCPERFRTIGGLQEALKLLSSSKPVR